MAIASLIREQLFNARYYVRNRTAANEQNEAFEPDFMQECYVPLFEGEIPLKAHVHRADDILTAIRIAKEFGLGAYA